MTKDKIDAFEKIQAQLEGLHSEISQMSRKSQNDALNTFKLNFVNQILVEANLMLGVKYKPFPNFDEFDENQIPTNSDAGMMLNQYLSCFEKLRADNVFQDSLGRWKWAIDGKDSHIRTEMPKKLKNK